MRAIRNGFAVALPLLAAVGALAWADPEPTLPPAGASAVKLERIDADEVESLRFLRANVAFFRAQLDRVREKSVQSDAAAAIVDPRSVRYQELLAQARDGRGTIDGAGSLAGAEALGTHLERWGALVASLNQVEAALAEQSERLDAMESDYLEHEPASLVVLLRVRSGGAPPRLALDFQTGARVESELSIDARAALERGGIAELAHVYVEPHEQTVDLWAPGAADPIPLAVYPESGRMQFLLLEWPPSSEEPPAIEAAAWTEPLGSLVPIPESEPNR